MSGKESISVGCVPPAYQQYFLVAATRCQYQWGSRYIPLDTYDPGIPTPFGYLPPGYLSPQNQRYPIPFLKGPVTRDTYPPPFVDRMTDRHP